MSATGFPVELEHPIYGPCRLLRVEGMNWVMEIARTGTQLRIPVTRRGEFSIAAAAYSGVAPSDPAPRREGFFAGGMEPTVSEPSPSGTAIPETERVAPVAPVAAVHRQANAAGHAPSSAPSSQSSESPRRTEGFFAGDFEPGGGSPRDSHRPEAVESDTSAPPLDPQHRRRLKRAIESLRNGLPPTSVEAHKVAVGLEGFEREAGGLLHQVASDGGAVKVVRGAYGQGKTLSLNLAAELALTNGFWVAGTEVDASENRLDRPSQVYRSLMQSLRIPNCQQRGVHQAATRIATITRPRAGVDADCYYHNIALIRAWLERELHCKRQASCM